MIENKRGGKILLLSNLRMDSCIALHEDTNRDVSIVYE